MIFSIIDKAKRIRQLKEWGYNTPKIMKIAYGTKFDRKLYQKLKKFAGLAKIMTVRTYSPVDEKLDFKTDFFPEIPTEEAIGKIKDLVSKYNILFQEAIDVKTTLITGNIALKKDESGFYDILKGKHRVRDVDNPPSGAKRISKKFNTFSEIDDIEMRMIIYEVKEIPQLVAYPDGVIIEFDLHNKGVGERKENLIIWEYRPLS